MELDLATFGKAGFAILPDLLSESEVAQLIERLEATATPEAGRGGIRDIMSRTPELRAVAEHPNVRSIINRVLGPNAFVVRSTFFDKTPDANWKVPWHQDVTIAVDKKSDIPGYGPWSVKQGVTHVQPPSEVLERMVTVRVHLDPCPASNGALRVMPGTQSLGRIDQNSAPGYVDEEVAVTCEVAAGGALVMRPLLLHASSASSEPEHRRVLHFDFANATLAGDLRWHLAAQ